MKLYDFDGMFDLKLGEYIKNNPEKYTESEWEDVIPKLYKSFGDTFIKSVGDTPNGFFAKLSEGELISALSAYIKQGVPVSKFLYEAIEKRCTVELLLPLLDGSEGEKEHAVNLIGSSDKAIKKYLQMLVAPDCGEELKNSLSDLIKEKADLVTDEAVDLYEKGIESALMLEIMSRSVIRNDKVFDILIKEFRSSEDNIPMLANALAEYGDERALEYLLDKIDSEGITYLEYKELLLAIESLGGSYDKERDFSSDPYYELLKSHELPAQDIFSTTDKK